MFHALKTLMNQGLSRMEVLRLGGIMYDNKKDGVIFAKSIEKIIHRFALNGEYCTLYRNMPDGIHVTDPTISDSDSQIQGAVICQKGVCKYFSRSTENIPFDPSNMMAGVEKIKQTWLEVKD